MNDLIQYVRKLEAEIGVWHEISRLRDVPHQYLDKLSRLETERGEARARVAKLIDDHAAAKPDPAAKHGMLG